MMRDSDATVIQFLDQLIFDATTNDVSDIHIEPMQDDYRIRTRKDGVLIETNRISVYFGRQLITRLKVLAEMNIAEKRYPQDGQITLQLTLDTTDYKALKPSIEIRASTCPTYYGEKIALRLLNQSAGNLSLHHLGLTDIQLQLLRQVIAQPQGLILIAGPTGSGKTMTLYSILNHLNNLHKNILTIEDPIEMSLPGLIQVNVNPAINLTFSTALRAILRHDPDIIMIGEIRDKETAQIALHAAQSGHLVLATLHGVNVQDSYSRLLTFELPHYPLLQSISLLISQRLVRTRCKNHQSNDCTQCVDGYHGRLGIFELLAIDPSLRHRLLQNNPHTTFAQQIDSRSFQSMWEIGLQRVQQGLTDQAELSRVVPRPNGCEKNIILMNCN